MMDPKGLLWHHGSHFTSTLASLGDKHSVQAQGHQTPVMHLFAAWRTRSQQDAHKAMTVLPAASGHGVQGCEELAHWFDKQNQNNWQSMLQARQNCDVISLAHFLPHQVIPREPTDADLA